MAAGEIEARGARRCLGPRATGVGHVLEAADDGDVRNAELAAFPFEQLLAAGDPAIDTADLRGVQDRLVRHELTEDFERQGILEVLAYPRVAAGGNRTNLVRRWHSEGRLQRPIQNAVEVDFGLVAGRTRADDARTALRDLSLPTKHLFAPRYTDRVAGFSEREVLACEFEVVAVDPLGVLRPEHIEKGLPRLQDRIESRGHVVVLCRPVGVAAESQVAMGARRVEKL